METFGTLYIYVYYGNQTNQLITMKLELIVYYDINNLNFPLGLKIKSKNTPEKESIRVYYQLSTEDYYWHNSMMVSSMLR